MRNCLLWTIMLIVSEKEPVGVTLATPIARTAQRSSVEVSARVIA
jgi:hypothetical protein